MHNTAATLVVRPGQPVLPTSDLYADTRADLNLDTHPRNPCTPVGIPSPGLQVDVDARDRRGDTALHLGARRGHVNIVKTLLKRRGLLSNLSRIGGCEP